MKAATILGKIITYFYSSISYELNLINKIFFLSNEKANKTSNISTKYNMNSHSNLNITRKQYQNNILIGSSYVKSIKNNENIKILRKYSTVNPIKLPNSLSFHSDKNMNCSSSCIIQNKTYKSLKIKLNLSISEKLFSRVFPKCYQSNKNIKFLIEG